jgi:hypothetical protein
MNVRMRLNFVRASSRNPLLCSINVDVVVLFFSGNGKLSSAGAMVGFVVMMSLDVGLG